MDLTYRKTTLADLEQVKHLGIISYGQFAGILGAENWNTMKTTIESKDFWDHILNGSSGFVCCHKDASTALRQAQDSGSATNEKIVGMAFLFPSGTGWHFFKPEWCYLRMVGVDPAYGGKGIAKTLTKKCLDHAKENGEKTIALHTSEFMDAARHIYESLGFKIKEPLEGRYGKKYWLYTLNL